MAMKKALFLVGTMNQLTMQHKVALELADEVECWFSPYYFRHSPVFWTLDQLGFLKHTFSPRLLGWMVDYLRTHHLAIDYQARLNTYDLVVMGVDQYIPANLQGKRSRKILIQEGLIWPEGLRYRLARNPFMPRFIANSNAMGLSNDYEFYCVASQGYYDWFASNGIQPERMVVTGLPNFDRIREDALAASFEHEDFLLFATHCQREDWEKEDRIGLLLKAKRSSQGKKIIVKLHPREDFERSTREVNEVLPEALVYTEGDAAAMIARCSLFMTTFSTCIFNALILEKEIVHCDLALERLKSLLPIQNDCAARNIADVCRGVLF